MTLLSEKATQSYAKAASTSFAWKSKRSSFMLGIKKLHRSVKGQQLKRTQSRKANTRIVGHQKPTKRPTESLLDTLNSMPKPFKLNDQLDAAIYRHIITHQKYKIKELD